MKKIFVFIAGLSLIFLSCDDKKDGGGIRGFSSEILINWVDNIIQPSFKNYQNKANDLLVAAENFENAPTESGLQSLKDKWLEAYKAYQRTIIFDFGLVEKLDYIHLSNTYPVKIRKENVDDDYEIAGIEDNIKLVADGKADDISLGEKDVITDVYKYQGFPALDYLLFADGKDFNYYQNHQAARSYMKMLAKALKQQVDKIVSYWDSNRDSYANDSNQSITGKYSVTVNAFVRIFESRIRSQKIGQACGAIPNQDGVPSIKHIEAYYNANPEVSKELLKVALKSSQDFFSGKHFDSGREGKSLKSALKGLGRDKLAESIEKQYDVIYKKIDELPSSSSIRSLAEEGEKISNASFRTRPLYPLFFAMQQNVVNLKRRMLAEALNAQIDYSDGDGD